MPGKFSAGEVAIYIGHGFLPDLSFYGSECTIESEYGLFTVKFSIHDSQPILRPGYLITFQHTKTIAGHTLFAPEFWLRKKPPKPEVTEWDESLFIPEGYKIPESTS